MFITMKRKIRLKELANATGLSECDSAIAIFLLLENPDILKTSREPCDLVRKKVERAKENNYFEFFKQMKTNNIKETLSKTRIGINFWYCPRDGSDCKLSVPIIINSFHPDSFTQVINLLVSRDNYQTDKCFNEDLTLMIRMDDFFAAQSLPKSFIDCVAEYANVSTSFLKSWPTTFSFFDERDFVKLFGFGYEIYTVDTRWCKIDRKVVIAKKRVYKSSQKHFCILQFMQSRWPEDKHEIKPYDMFILRAPDDFRIYYCTNEFCFYNTFDETQYNSHIPSCKKETKVDYKQLDLARQTPKAYLISKGLIPSTDCFNAAFYDIECLMKEENVPISEHTFLKNTHKVVSISVTINFAHKGTKVFTRCDYSEQSLHKLMKDFWSYLKNIRDLHIASLPDHQNALSIIYDQIDNASPFQDCQILYECKNYLKEILTLKTLAWNGEHYDLPIIFGPLLQYLNPRDSDKRETELNVIKRGLGFMQLSFDGIKLTDAMLFFPHVSLDTFGQLFKAKVQKLTFCYEYFNSITEAENTTSFPAYSAFKSSFIYNTIDDIYSEIKTAFALAKDYFQLTSHQFFVKLDIFDYLRNYIPSQEFPQSLEFTENAHSIFCTSVTTYVNSWIKFEKMKANGECSNMATYLYFYNSLDTQVLSEAFTNMMQIFSNRFHQNLIEYASLPSVAYAILWENYSLRYNHPYSFGPLYSEIAKETRNAILGGLAGPLHIHVEVNAPVTYANAVHFGPNDQPYVAILGVDAGSKTFLRILY